MTTLTVGERMYNHGDMTNPDHFGTITDIKTDRWGTQYEITPDPGSDRQRAYWIPAVMVSDEYRGNGLTRIVTETAYNIYHEACMAKLQAWVHKAESA